MPPIAGLTYPIDESRLSPEPRRPIAVVPAVRGGGRVVPRLSEPQICLGEGRGPGCTERPSAGRSARHRGRNSTGSAEPGPGRSPGHARAAHSYRVHNRWPSDSAPGMVFWPRMTLYMAQIMEIWNSIVSPLSVGLPCEHQVSRCSWALAQGQNDLAIRHEVNRARQLVMHMHLFARATMRCPHDRHANHCGRPKATEPSSQRQHICGTSAGHSGKQRCTTSRFIMHDNTCKGATHTSFLPHVALPSSSLSHDTKLLPERAFSNIVAQ